jgi:hypothetical protein
MRWYSKLMSDNNAVSFKRHISLFFAIEAAVIVIYVIFIRGNLTATEERLIEFLAGFATVVYAGPEIATRVANRNNLPPADTVKETPRTGLTDTGDPTGGKE